jgi:hypothetical protein
VFSASRAQRVVRYLLPSQSRLEIDTSLLKQDTVSRKTTNPFQSGEAAVHKIARDFILEPFDIFNQSNQFSK